MSAGRCCKNDSVNAEETGRLRKQSLGNLSISDEESGDGWNRELIALDG